MFVIDFKFSEYSFRPKTESSVIKIFIKCWVNCIDRKISDSSKLRNYSIIPENMHKIIITHITFTFTYYILHITFYILHYTHYLTTVSKYLTAALVVPSGGGKYTRVHNYLPHQEGAKLHILLLCYYTISFRAFVGGRYLWTRSVGCTTAECRDQVLNSCVF
jgi:hypothetical protein